MDLATIQPKAIKVAIKDPATGKPTGLIFDVVSEYDPRVKAAERAGRSRVMQNKGLTPDLVEENYRARLTAAITGWEWTGDATWRGEKPKFTPENLTDVLEADYIRAQIDDAFSVTDSFFARS